MLLFSLTAQQNLYTNRLYTLQVGGAPTAPACAATRLLTYRLRVLLSDLHSAAAHIVQCQIFVNVIKFYSTVFARTQQSPRMHMSMLKLFVFKPICFLF